MNGLTIKLEGMKSSYGPGDELSVIATWNSQEAPGPMEIRLFWFTGGMSPQQIGIVEIQTLERSGPSGFKNFKFVLPEGPRSFFGVLASLNWAIEAVAVQSKIHARAIFTVGTEESEGLLYKGAATEERPEE